MKKTIVILLCLWMMQGVSVAQDIYTSGYFINPSGEKAAAVFKNNGVIFRKAEEGREMCSPSMAIDTMTDDIYWACNSYPVDVISNSYGYLMKNDEVLLDNVLGTRINAISFDGNDIYSGGYINDLYESVAAVWKNGEVTPLYTYCNGMTRSEVLGVVVVDGVVYACGYYDSGLRYGCVWVNGELYASYPNQKVSDITYYDGDIYYYVEDATVTIYMSGNEYGTLMSNGGYAIAAYDIKVSDDDVYIVGFMGFNDLCVWKNAEILYLHPYARDANFHACQVYEGSLYYVGYDHEDHAIVYKDGQQIGSTKFQYYYDVCVRPDVLAAEEDATEEIAIYPNPAKGNIAIKGVNTGDIIRVFNTTGQLVMTVTADSNKVDISGLPAGLYMIQCGNSYNSSVIVF